MVRGDGNPDVVWSGLCFIHKSPKIRYHVRLSCITAVFAMDHTLYNVVTKGFSFVTQVNYYNNTFQYNKTGIPDNIMLHAHFLFTLGNTNPKFQLP